MHDAVLPHSFRDDPHISRYTVDPNGFNLMCMPYIIILLFQRTDFFIFYYLHHNIAHLEILLMNINNA